MKFTQVLETLTESDDKFKKIETAGRNAAKDGKSKSDCPYQDEGSWDEKHSRSAWMKGFSSGKAFKDSQRFNK